MDDYQRGVWAAYDAARGTNADLCTTPSRAYQLMLEAINKLRHAAPEQKVPAMTDPSPRMREQMLDLVVSAIRNTEVGHPLAPGERQTLCDALADGINFDPTDDSAATIYDALHAIANAAVAAADLTSQAAEIERLREALEEIIMLLRATDALQADGFADQAVRRARAALNGESHD